MYPTLTWWMQEHLTSDNLFECHLLISINILLEYHFHLIAEAHSWVSDHYLTVALENSVLEYDIDILGRRSFPQGSLI